MLSNLFVLGPPSKVHLYYRASQKLRFGQLCPKCRKANSSQSESFWILFLIFCICQQKIQYWDSNAVYQNALNCPNLPKIPKIAHSSGQNGLDLARMPRFALIACFIYKKIQRESFFGRLPLYKSQCLKSEKFLCGTAASVREPNISYSSAFGMGTSIS